MAELETFTARPQWNMKRKSKPELNVVKFGNGYEQRSPKGLHNHLRTYDVVFKGSEEMINRIDDFLIRHNGYKAFFWTPYGEQKGRFRCEEWDKTFSTGFFELTATFIEVVM